VARSRREAPVEERGITHRDRFVRRRRALEELRHLLGEARHFLDAHAAARGSFEARGFDLERELLAHRLVSQELLPDPVRASDRHAEHDLVLRRAAAVVVAERLRADHEEAGALQRAPVARIREGIHDLVPDHALAAVHHARRDAGLVRDHLVLGRRRDEDPQARGVLLVAPAPLLHRPRHERRIDGREDAVERGQDRVLVTRAVRAHGVLDGFARGGSARGRGGLAHQR
jgi:hypothetical protein